MKLRKVAPPALRPATISGRVITDERGNNQWECSTETGSFSSDADTQRVLKALHNDELALCEDSPVAAPNYNPYDKAHERPIDDKPHTSLDGIRTLSDRNRWRK